MGLKKEDWMHNGNTIDLNGIERYHISDFTNDPSARIWVISDTHFNHKNILKYEPSRPGSDKAEMDAILIERWNSVVGKNDVVIHLGDFAFATPNRIKEYVSKLNGNIVLLLGNHDMVTPSDWTSLGFKVAFVSPFLFEGKFILSHEPLESIPEGYVNVYGHVHGSPCFNTVDSNRLCACVERWDCKPISWADDILNRFPTSE